MKWGLCNKNGWMDKFVSKNKSWLWPLVIHHLISTFTFYWRKFHKWQVRRPNPTSRAILYTRNLQWRPTGVQRTNKDSSLSERVVVVPNQTLGRLRAAKAVDLSGSYLERSDFHSFFFNTNTQAVSRCSSCGQGFWISSVVFVTQFSSIFFRMLLLIFWPIYIWPVVSPNEFVNGQWKLSILRLLCW